MNSILNDIPSIPKIPSIAPLHLGITTRVMAKRQAQERERLKQLEEHKVPPRRLSKFLKGAAIPNSVIKAEIPALELPAQDGSQAKNNERDAFVGKLLKHVQPERTYEDVDKQAFDKIKNELRKRNLLPPVQNINDDKANIKNNKDNKKSVRDPWEELKEKRRISLRASNLVPLEDKQHPTYESIKKAIQNSKIIQQFLDAENVAKQKMNEEEKEKLLASEINPDESNQTDPEMPISSKATKKEGSKNTKASRGSKQQTSEKSVTSKHRTSNDLKKPQRRSTLGSKTLKKELNMQSNKIINDILQQRRHTT